MREAQRGRGRGHYSPFMSRHRGGGANRWPKERGGARGRSSAGRQWALLHQSAASPRLSRSAHCRVVARGGPGATPASVPPGLLRQPHADLDRQSGGSRWSDEAGEETTEQVCTGLNSQPQSDVVGPPTPRPRGEWMPSHFIQAAWRGASIEGSRRRGADTGTAGRRPVPPTLIVCKRQRGHRQAVPLRRRCVTEPPLPFPFSFPLPLPCRRWGGMGANDASALS